MATFPEQPAPWGAAPPIVYVREKTVWQYKQITRDLAQSNIPNEDELNELGKDGWEMVSSVQSMSIQAWARGERVLRTMVGVEIGSTSKAALRWATELRGIGRCDLLVTHIAWPPGEHLRLGIPSPFPSDGTAEAEYATLIMWSSSAPIRAAGVSYFRNSTLLGSHHNLALRR